MDGFLAFIFWLIVTILIIRLFFRYVLPYLLKRWVRKQEKQYNSYDNGANPHKEETSYKSAPKSKSTNTKNISDIAEEVDFEE